jgi:hypothetical protein
LTRRAARNTHKAMSAGPKDPKSKPSPDPREARLAKALRENLRRRKAGADQSRIQTDSDKSTR